MFKALLSAIFLIGNMEGEKVKEEFDVKARDCKKLACVFISQMDPMISGLVQATAQTAKLSVDIEKTISTVKERMLGEEIVKLTTQSIEKIFTHDDIKLLIKFYESEAVKKMYKTAPEVFSPISMAMQKIIQDLIPVQDCLDKIVSINNQNYQKEIEEFEGCIALEVYSAFCGPCQIVAPIFSELSIEMEGKARFCKLDLNSEPALREKLEIHSVPTILFVRNGKIVDRHVGLINKDDLRKKIEEKSENH